MRARRRRLVAEKSVSPDLRELKEVRQIIEGVASEAHLTEEDTYDLKVAVSEACANAIEHPDQKESVRLAAWLESDRVLVEIKAPGEFRVKQSNGNQHRGLGLPLMVALVDELLLSRPPGGGTCVRLSMFFH